jgi:hypothetical protein
VKITVPCSSMQEETIAQHALGLCELVVFPGERAWMVDQARKQVPNCRVVGAHLDIENGRWNLEVEA